MIGWKSEAASAFPEAWMTLQVLWQLFRGGSMLVFEMAQCLGGVRFLVLFLHLMLFCHVRVA